MKIILSVDALTEPLTGIGRYTLELANGLNNYQIQLKSIESLKFYKYGKWIGDINSLLDKNPNTDLSLSLTNNINKFLKGNKCIKKAYQIINPYLTKFRLNKFDEYIYHSPNFYIPRGFSGKTIATVHDLSIFKYPQFHPKSRVEYMEKEIYHTIKNADFLLTISENSKKEIIDFFGYDKNKIDAIPLAAQNNFKPYQMQETNLFLSQFGLKHKQYILCLSTIEPRKNIETLLSAYEQLPAYIKNHFPLVIAGGKGWDSDKIYQKMENLIKNGLLKYLGYVSEHNLPLLLSGAKLFVFPSIYEGFGLPLLEAMACKVPVIASNSSSLPEVAGGAACLLGSYDSYGFSQSIANLIEDENLCNKRGEAALEISKQYTWQATIEKTVASYNKL